MRARWIIGVVILVVTAMLFLRGPLERLVFRPTGSALPDGVSTDAVVGDMTDRAAPAAPVEVVATGLRIPWEIAFLPDGDLLVTERPGTLVRIGAEGKTYAVEGVRHVGEGGLLGLALHPDFAENRYIYLYLTSSSGGGVENRIERYVLDHDALSDRTVILEGIPGAMYHDGGRIAFGPDGMLYATTGDASDSANARSTDSLAGKILRMTDEGEVPADNPFGNHTWSYGHRNPQGIDWDDQGRLWQSEHGRSGARSGMDEINLIVRGGDYGWPTIEGSETVEGMMTPIADSGADETWAPGDIAWMGDGRLLFTGLRGESLYEGKLSDDGRSLEIVAHFRGDFGRIRAVVIGPDGAIYLSTSNTDGRGTPKADDDTILRISREALSL
jgi:glucose/arabinose dehydrogenase